MAEFVLAKVGLQSGSFFDVVFVKQPNEVCISFSLKLVAFSFVKLGVILRVVQPYDFVLNCFMMMPEASDFLNANPSTLLLLLSFSFLH